MIESLAGPALAYIASGLALSSEMHLPELSARKEIRADSIKIRMGAVPTELEERTARGPLFEVSRRQFLLRLPGVASYLVTDGSEIVVDKAANADDDSLRLFLLGSVFGALAHQRGLFPLHASAIETPHGAVLFAGASGVGKSALAAVFWSRGYRVIADEICVVDIDSGYIQPAFPRLLLWPDVIEEAGLSSPGIRPARLNLKKYHVPIPAGFARNALPVHAIYVVRVTLGGKFDVARLTGAAKVSALMNITYRRQFLKGMNSEVRHFDRITRTARRMMMSTVSRPITGRLLETADLLERDFAR